MTKKKKVIAIRHSFITSIGEEEVEEALEQEYSPLRIKHVEIRSASGDYIGHEHINTINWNREASHQKEVYEKSVKPLIDKHPDYDIVYFGATYVPLAIHLGSLFGTWNAISVFLKNHRGSKNWYRKLVQNGAEQGTNEIVARGVPQEENDTSEDVLICISTSYEIKKEEVLNSIQSKIAKTIEIYFEPLILDIPSMDVVEEMSDKFATILNQIAKKLQYIDTVHIITAVPVGLAFLLGTHISANVHRKMLTYQYDSRETTSYSSAIAIGVPLEVEYELSNEEKERVAAVKQSFKETCWTRLKSYIEETTPEKKQEWYGPLVDKKDKKLFDYHFWNGLPSINETTLPKAEFSDVVQVENGFKLRKDIEGYSWALDEQLVFQIANQLDWEEKATNRALRMLLLHEGGPHYRKHRLLSSTADGIGRFPKMLERADYQADVWAMIYEYHYSKRYHPGDIKKDDPSYFFTKVIHTALSTMWAFDDGGVELIQMQIRRLNRYLIWYWQLARIQDERCNSLSDVLRVLVEFPIVEVKGLLPKTEGHRVFYRFDSLNKNDVKPELGVFWQNEVKRIGDVEYLTMHDLVNAFKARDSNKIAEYVTALYDTVA